jgi:AAA+ ATPase superfamily predicted ATPase
MVLRVGSSVDEEGEERRGEVSPEEIAEKIITVDRNGDKPEWAVAIRPNYQDEERRTGVMLGVQYDNQSGAEMYARMIRSVFEKVISDIVNECIDIVDTANVVGVTSDNKREIASAIHERFSRSAN